MNLIIILVFTLLGAISFIITSLLRRSAGKNKIVSIPNERSLHDTPTPSGGGLAIVITWYLGLTFLYLSGSVEKELYYALLCGILLAVTGIIDDIIGLPVILRLIVQFMTSILAFFFLHGLRQLIIPEIAFHYQIVVYPVAIIGMVWFINLFNFMDGVDGFASTEAIFVSLVLLAYTLNPSTLLLIFCVAGFIYWNWPKAKIFMGDVGSTQLGFILIVCGIYFHNTYKFSILNWIMITSPFWFDATFTLIRRWRNGEELSKAHKKHAYQRIVRSGFSHLRVNIWLIAINCLVVIMILIYREIKFLQIPLFVLTLIFFYLITRIVDRKVPF